MAKWVEGVVVNNRRWTDTLHSLQIDAQVAPFEAGQFTKLALKIGGELVARPYSFVNAPQRSPLEFYLITVPGGPLSERLVTLKTDEPIWVAPKAAGFLTLAELPDAENLWMLSTGTAIGPFLSILHTGEPWRRFKKIILVHAVRTAAELTYQAEIQQLHKKYGEQFVMVPFVSREDTDYAIKGRVPAAIQDGSLEQRAGAALTAEHSQVMICGNPSMVEDTSGVLQERGLKKNQRRDPGQITAENYWKLSG